MTLYRLTEELKEDEINEEEDQTQQQHHHHHSYGNDLKELESLTSLQLQDNKTFIQNIKWHSSRDTILTLDALNLSLWSLREASITVRRRECARERERFLLFCL